jgi:hypothetical protein
MPPGDRALRLVTYNVWFDGRNQASAWAVKPCFSGVGHPTLYGGIIPNERGSGLQKNDFTARGRTRPRALWPCCGCSRPSVRT